MSALQHYNNPLSPSTLRRLVARHPVAAFLVMVYAITIAVALLLSSTVRPVASLSQH